MNTIATIDNKQHMIEPGTRTTAGPSGVWHQLARLATWRAWTASAVVFVVYALAFFKSPAPFAIPKVQALCGEPPLDMRVTSTAEEVNGFLTTCGSVGREAYRALQLADLLYPLVFAVFLASCLALVITRLAPTHPRLLALAALPFLASTFDYVENALAWRALTAFPQATTTDGLLGVASLAKTATSWLAGGLLIAVAAALLLSAATRAMARARHWNHHRGDGLPR